MTDPHECGFRVFGECDGVNCDRVCSAKIRTVPQIELPLIQPMTRKQWRVATAVMWCLLALAVGLALTEGPDRFRAVQIAEVAQ